ncbi:unnamed protein product [Prunus brigantina]
MSVFRLPIAICNEVESILARFWWSKDQHWHSPLVGYFKLNVDGALHLRDGLWGVGLIVRDSHDVLIEEVAMRAPSLLSMLATKLYALKVGLSFALDASLLP